MTNQEAIKGLNNLFSEHELTLPCTDSLEILHMSVAALEKQIPKKIVHNPEAGREADWTCPACKWTCSPYARHCQNCGQALYNEEYVKD